MHLVDHIWAATSAPWPLPLMATMQRLPGGTAGSRIIIITCKLPMKSTKSGDPCSSM